MTSSDTPAKPATDALALPGPAARPRRADAERSVEAILDATLKALSADGSINMSAIARAAGISRVTLYTHFPTREVLLDAALRRAFEETREALDGLDLDSSRPADALGVLLSSSWQVLERHRNLYVAAATALSPAELYTYAGPVLRRLESLLARGQAVGDFRPDLPLDWLSSTVYTLMHMAAGQVATGHLPAEVAGYLVSTTVRGMLRPAA